jgi:hypothetical protein
LRTQEALEVLRARLAVHVVGDAHALERPYHGERGILDLHGDEG